MHELNIIENITMFIVDKFCLSFYKNFQDFSQLLYLLPHEPPINYINYFFTIIYSKLYLRNPGGILTKLLRILCKILTSHKIICFNRNILSHRISVHSCVNRHTTCW